MKIKISQLRKLIKESIEEVINDTIATSEEFDKIISEIKLNEDFGVTALTLGAILGIFAYGGSKITNGSASEAASSIVNMMNPKSKAQIRQKAADIGKTPLCDAVESLSKDLKLEKMFNTLADMKNVATVKEISNYSKDITEYVQSHINQLGVDPMDVRKELGKKFLSYRYKS